MTVPKPKPFISKKVTVLSRGLGLRAVPSTGRAGKRFVSTGSTDRCGKVQGGVLRNTLRDVHAKAESIPFKLPGAESLVTSLESKA